MLAATDGCVAWGAHGLTDGRLILVFTRLIRQNVLVHEEVDSACRIQMPVDRRIFIPATLHVADLVRLLLTGVLQDIIVFASFFAAVGSAAN